jgi:hypothetical protein
MSLSIYIIDLSGQPIGQARWVVRAQKELLKK